MEILLQKFIPFVKVDSVRREVSGIVTAEAPDKDNEVCDYEKTVPYYKAVIAEFDKATDGKNFMPLREMHGLSAVGKGIGFEFRDQEKAIFMTFKVVDDDAWKKVEERVYTGFSQGGRVVGDMVPDPKFKGCRRYVANPSEVSLVDNPCLPDAHFTHVKADGQIEICKFLKTEVPPSQLEQAERIATLEDQVKALQKASITAVTKTTDEPLSKEAKTKRVGGKDLPASDFAYVGDPEKTATWKLPIHDASHVRNALARFNQTQGIPSGEKSKVHARIVAAAKKHGVDVASENEKLTAIRGAMRKAIRVYVNSNPKIKSQSVLVLDYELGKLGKGMYQVSSLASALENIACLLYSAKCEEEWELDGDSNLPPMLADIVESMSECLIEMVDEEVKELLAHARAS